jgi:Fic family protein
VQAGGRRYDVMVSIKKKVLGNQTYYYLEHTLRKGIKIRKKEKYIGKHLPKNIDEVKREFLSEIYKEKWYSLFDNIARNFSREQELMPVTAKQKNLETFVIKFTYDTQRIEGSKLTLRETADLLEHGITPKAKPIQDAKEAEAHKEIFYEMMRYEKDLSLEVILYWHKKLFESTKPDIAGKIRQHQVAISGSKFMPPLYVEIYPLLMEFFSWYAKNKSKMHPVELAAIAHLKLVTIHPFADGNGRISRLVMNFILQRYGYPMFDIPYENRTSYYNALERSQMKKFDGVFLQWFFKRYVKEYSGYTEKENV